MNSARKTVYFTLENCISFKKLFRGKSHSPKSNTAPSDFIGMMIVQIVAISVSQCAILATHNISTTQLYPAPERFQVTGSSGSVLPVRVTLDAHIRTGDRDFILLSHSAAETQSVDGSHQGQVHRDRRISEYSNPVLRSAPA